MESATGSSWRPAMAGGERILGVSPILLAVLVQLAVWSIGPGLLFGNLHSDTLEAAYWGRDWALGYAKHPPVTTWLIDSVLRLPIPRIFGLMLLSQATMAVAAFFLWRLARLYSSRETAALVVLLFLTSPAATIYAVQLNHNSMLAPFWAASAYFGMQYLEERRWSDAIGLGIAAGLGALTKYEMMFLLAALVTVAIVVRRFRAAFFHPASYVCLAVFLLVLAPHIWWLDTNRWPSLSRALGTEKVSNIAALNQSAVNGVVGLFTLFAMPVLVLLATLRARHADELTRGPGTKTIAAVLAFVPVLVLVIGSVATGQVMKPLWVLPLTGTVALGVGILCPAGDAGRGLGVRTSAFALMGGTLAIFLGFSGYLIIAGAIGKPLTAYSADARLLSREVEAYWAARQPGPLHCIVIADRKIGPSGLLWMQGRPDYVDFSSPSWATPKQIGECRRTGGVAVLAEPSPALDSFPASCPQKQIFQMPAAPLLGRVKWPVELVYIPPEGTTDACDRK